MTVNEIIELLDKEENKFGGATGRERELNLSVNGEFLGSIKSAKLDGWGDGLITDVTLELQCREEIRAKAIDEIKDLKEKNETLKALYEDARKEGNNLLARIRNKSIDEYMTALCDKCLDQKNECYQLECQFCDDGCDIVNIAEKLKVGGENE